MHPLPPLLAIDEIQARLNQIFPALLPDRTILVGDMSARLHFVGLYGGFIFEAERFLRPSTVIRFTLEQAGRTSDAERYDWLSRCQSAGFVPFGRPWYADNSRETLRDDLIRNKCLPMGLIQKREGYAPTSPAPIYAFSGTYVSLFDPSLTGDALTTAINAWQEEYLDPAALTRMQLLAHGVLERKGQISVTLPTTGKTLRLAAGEASVITRDVCEKLAPMLFKKPVVVHVSMSDKKTFGELADEARIAKFKIDPKAALPDVVIVDVGSKGLPVMFVEVVHSDGAITDVRRDALLRIAENAGAKPDAVQLVTAFEDRGSTIFRKRFSELANGSAVWFRAEPDMLVRLDRLV
jgi:hypothetical protein